MPSPQATDQPQYQSPTVAALATFGHVIYPGWDSMSRVALLANVAHESWMQDWPIEVADPERLGEFLDLLNAKKADWELSFWLLDLVLESANDRIPEQTDPLT
ncbi:hypothetical protein NN3_07370 [Nocardia neocaledoniensis NBRC 108232]|nr:hypothetical protein NN3_07370 [Nocardia neocaledoniensis NBRC 108232]